MSCPYVSRSIVFREPPQESVEAVFAAVWIVADVIAARFGERGMQLGPRVRRAGAQRRLLGGGCLEQIGGQGEHAPGERHVRPDHAVTGAAALHPFREAAGPPQRQGRSVRRRFGLRDGALRQRGDKPPPLGHAVFTTRDRALRFRRGKNDGKRRCVIGQQNVRHAAEAELGANGDVPEQREGKRRRRATAAEDSFERGGRIEDGVDGACLQRLFGLASFGDIHPCDLVYQAGEVAPSQLAMDDGPYHASLPYGVRRGKLGAAHLSDYPLKPYARNHFPTLWTLCFGSCNPTRKMGVRLLTLVNGAV